MNTLWQVRDGDKIKSGQILCTIEGDAHILLITERVALYFLQTLSKYCYQNSSLMLRYYKAQK